MPKLLAIAGLMLAISSPAVAQESSPDPIIGNGMLDFCTRKQDGWETAYCAGYILATVDMDREIGLACVPTTVTKRQAIDLVVKELRNHPEERHLNSIDLITKYIGAAFPCPKSTNG
jgi:hypothetical protein